MRSPTVPHSLATVDDAAGVLTSAGVPLHARFEAFAMAMRQVLEEVAASHPRSTPREIVRQARRIGDDVLADLQDAQR